ncbi:MAG TPA: sigma factor [Acidimicrobiia bacterium]|nr:sigma factor [Acidimicrobiia bacterium]
MATTLSTTAKARHHLRLGERAELPATELGSELDPFVDGIRRRSDAAFRAVYEATADGLASFAYGMLGNRAAAEDAVQQAFLELVQAAASIRGMVEPSECGCTGPFGSLVWTNCEDVPVGRKPRSITCLNQRRRSRPTSDPTYKLPWRGSTVASEAW